MPKVIRAARPNAGIEARYRRQLQKLINEMFVATRAKLRPLYESQEWRIAQDQAPADLLAKAVASLRDDWLKRFDRLAPAMARWFALEVDERSTSVLKRALKQGNMSVTFQARNSQAVQDILASTVHENVNLIRSIPAEFLKSVESQVMQSVSTGRDLATLTRQLRESYGVSQRRAELIARDQNNKATSAIQKARQTEIGIKEGIWLHSNAGKQPRPKHVAAHGTRFNLADGLPVGDKGQWVMPGTEINCRCTWKPVVPGFS